MKHVRPHFVFNQLGDKDRMVTMSLPFQHSVTSMIERAVLLTLVKLVEPKRIFEFGTYLGEMTRMFAENTEAQIFTLDLGHGCTSEKLDGFEQKNLAKGIEQGRLYADRPYRGRITELFGDSTMFNFRPYEGSMDFILIDGGHHIDVVRKDTENAFQLCSRSGKRCIVWHDYGNPEYEITEYLDRLSEDYPLVHVEDTKYVYWFDDASSCG